MSVEVVRGTSQKPVSSDHLVNILSLHSELSGQLFVGYPIVGTSEGPYRIDALLISEDKGIVLFDLIEGTDASAHEWRQDDAANKLEARLKVHPELMNRRNLRIPIHTISFIPSVSTLHQHAAEYPIANRDTLVAALTRCDWQEPNDSVYRAALSAIESISTIRAGRARRTIKKEGSRGERLKRLEKSIATLDNTQSKAVIETVEGVQRIRGLAGSGKTIVLALKAAYLHAQHPDWRIAVTFYTRSLKGQFRRLINNFCLEQTSREPDWDNLRIVTAWGAPGGVERDGLYYEFCRTHDVEYYDLQAARRQFGLGVEFSGACAAALSQVTDPQPRYDAMLIDEAQDLSPAFLRLCYMFLKEPKRLVYAYDELQNLSGVSLPSPEHIFGSEDDGTPSVQFKTQGGKGPRHDIILDKCYRNSRPVLVTAHALGFGIYREPPGQSDAGLIQMFDNPQLWTEVGYEVKDGELSDGEQVTLRRTAETSPIFFENHSSIDDLIQFIPFDSPQEQAKWLAEEIRRNLTEDELRCDDIVVVNPDPPSTRTNVGPIRRQLLDMGINSHLAGVNTSTDVFFKPEQESVTFTGIYRAKGNEAGIVYVINAHDCHSSARNLATIRNRLFTAITRSKAWIRVLGVGSGMKELTKEFNMLKEKEFELRFVYPTKTQREHLSMVHRDMTMEESRRIRSRQKSVDDLVKDFEASNVLIEDLDEESIDKLRTFLLDGKGHANS